MTRKPLGCFVALPLALVLSRTAAAQTIQGQLSTWFTLNNAHPSTPGVGVRYIPTLTVEVPLPNSRAIDGEVSVNAYGFGLSPGWDEFDTSGDVKPYRIWARFKTPRFEGRVGLQQINFGSALLLRPLRWFDSVDPRDPLQITEGVHALLVRGYLPRDVTVWGWGLYGNEGVKGLELSPTREGTPEFGGRLQAPLFKGEMAFTTHHRRADLSQVLVAGSAGEDPLAREHRYAIDGKWDVGVGLWFEGAMAHQTRTAQPSADSGALTVGADYTVGLGNGLHVLGEYFVQDIPREIFGQRVTARFAALSLRYPLGLLDSISGIVYIDTKQAELYRFVNWQRTYDRWQFYVMGFWNPRQLALATSSSAGRSPLAGRGVQIMAVYNHELGRSRTKTAAETAVKVE